MNNDSVTEEAVVGVVGDEYAVEPLRDGAVGPEGDLGDLGEVGGVEEDELGCNSFFN